jgi:hypothetical protein
MTLRRALRLAVFAVVLLPAFVSHSFGARILPAPNPEGAVLDSGQFTVSVAGRVVGHERFSLQSASDSLVASVELRQFHPGDHGTDTLLKMVRFAVDSFDFSLKSYTAMQKFRGQSIMRAIVIADTTYTSYSQMSGGGEGNTFLLPPGRIYVLDPPVFTNLDMVCLNLKNKVFSTRPVTMLMMTPTRDTVITVTVTSLGRDTIQWAGRATGARHVTLGDENITYDVWMQNDGRMLRLEHRGTQMRVERDPPAAKRRSARRPVHRG